MNYLEKFKKNPLLVFRQLFVRVKLFRKLSDETYLKFVYFFVFKKRLNLENPKSFSEKLQWIKLYDRNPYYMKLVDKYEAKIVAESQIGEEHIIKTYGVWDNFDDIDFDKLPEKFVLKCTHDSGCVVICTDKNSFDINAAKAKINKGLNRNYYWIAREWPYKDVKPRIIAEEYIESNAQGGLKDYKFFCFDGEVKALFIASDRYDKSEELKFDFFDSDFNFIEAYNGHPSSNGHVAKPGNFEEMKAIASKLSKGFPEVRIDLYSVGDKIYFGEYTFFSNSGLVPIEPESFDLELGSYIKLPNKTVG